MKVILMQDVKKIGRKFDVVEVADGFALNSLIPTKKAIQATSDALSKVELWRESAMAERTKSVVDAQAALADMANISLVVNPNVNDAGTLYESIDAADIAALVGDYLGKNIPADVVIMDHPIKRTGEHVVTLKAGEIERTITLQVGEAEVKPTEEEAIETEDAQSEEVVETDTKDESEPEA